MSQPDDILDDLFHGCAFAAFLHEAAEAKGSPCPNSTRVRAYALYEQALAEKNGPTKHLRESDNSCIVSESVEVV